jgi:hypothetical protein
MSSLRLYRGLRILFVFVSGWAERISGAGLGGDGVESDGNEYHERCYGMDVRWTGGQLVAHVLSQSLR